MASELSDQTPDAESHMRALHRATLALFSDLSLDGVLQRIIQAAKELVGAGYAAIGIPDGKGGLETFLTIGMTDEEIQAIDHQPIGKGLLGEMLRKGRSIRVPEISEHSQSVGFPPGHPEMHSFLGVPISAYGRPLGQIYLTDKQEAAAFSAEDQRLIEMLAAHAAAAIENARLYRQVLDSENELTQRNLELELINTLATAVSSSMELDDLLAVMLNRGLQLFSALAGEIFLRDESEGGFRMAIHQGELADSFWDPEEIRAGESFVARVASLGQPSWTTGLLEKHSSLRPRLLEQGVGTLVGVPLTAPGKVMGVMVMALEGSREFQERELGLLRAVGAGVGIAVENARLYRQAKRLAVLEERERIGMDLHDGVIQSIYAVGLTLEYTRLLVKEEPGEAYDRLEQVIQALNETIGDIRSYILDLQPSRIQIDDFQAAIARLAREFKANTLVEVETKLEQAAVNNLGRKTATEFFHIAQEALANVAKHARASRVLVAVRRLGGDIILQVIDNGRGFKIEDEPSVLGHGLSNMTERARQIGADLKIVSSPGDGTTVTIRLSLEAIAMPEEVP
jgi:signal transduction histidine kinase